MTAPGDDTAPADARDTKAPADARAQAQAGEAPGEGAASGDGEAGPEAAQPPPEAAQPPPVDPREARIRHLEALVAEREQTLHDYIKAHKKAQGEFDAFRQRLLRDQDRDLEVARGRLVEGLLSVLDNLDLTAESVRRGGSTESLAAGIDLVRRQFVQQLTEMGLTRFDPTGERFDPTTMEAMAMVPVADPSQDGVVVATIKPGFRIGEREIRPALVQVGRKA